MEALFEELKKSPDFKISSGIHAQLLDCYAYNGKLDEAFDQLNIIKQMEGENFSLDESKIVRIVTLLIKSSKLEEALRFLEGKLLNYISLFCLLYYIF